MHPRRQNHNLQIKIMHRIHPIDFSCCTTIYPLRHIPGGIKKLLQLTHFKEINNREQRVYCLSYCLKWLTCCSFYIKCSICSPCCGTTQSSRRRYRTYAYIHTDIHNRYSENITTPIGKVGLKADHLLKFITPV